MDLLRSWLHGREKPAVESRAADQGEGSTVIKEDPMVIDGRCLTIAQFAEHLKGLMFPDGLPNRIFLHHTWRPTRETWQGRTTILGMKAYYEQQLWVDEQGRKHEGWTAGPHLFIADDGIWLFSDLNYDGVGVAGHNTGSRHIEVVGNFDEALPDGPTWQNAVAALGLLHERLGIAPERLNFHRDFSTKTCPGTQVQKSWVIPQVQRWIEDYRAAQQAQEATLRGRLCALAGDLLLPVASGTALADAAMARGLLGPVSNEVPMEVGGRAYIVQLYAEALVVPVNAWEQVTSLAELEAQPEDATEAAVAEEGDLPIYDVTDPPGDVIAFDGKLR